MKFNHNTAHYFIGGTALVIALVVGAAERHNTKHAKQQDSAIARLARVTYAKNHGWANLTQDQVIALGEALKPLKPVPVTLYCASVSCAALRNDIDDAFQIAGWVSAFEDRPVDSEADQGIFVGTADSRTTMSQEELRNNEVFVVKVSQVLGQVLNLDAQLVPIDGIKGIGIIFGKRP